MLASSSNLLDFSVVGLFPNIENAAQDQKCQLVAELIQELAAPLDKSTLTQNKVQEYAKRRYEELSQVRTLLQPEADGKAFMLYRARTSVPMAKKYYSFLLSEANAKRWQIALYTPELSGEEGMTCSLL